MQFFIVKTQSKKVGVVPTMAYYRTNMDEGSYWDANGLFFWLMEFDHIGIHPFDGRFANSLGAKAAALGKMIYFVEELGLYDRMKKDPVQFAAKQIINTIKEIDEDGLSLELESKLPPQDIKSPKIDHVQNMVFSFLGRYEIETLNIAKVEILGHIIRSLAWGWNNSAFNYPKDSQHFEFIHYIYANLKKITSRISLDQMHSEGCATLTIEHGYDQDEPFIQAAFEL